MNNPQAKPNMSTLFSDFYRYFELSIAHSEEARRAVYAVRYSVYCEEFGYEDPQAFKDNLETDLFDEYSLHCLVTHRASGLPAGCVRLVTVNDDLKMPLESHCSEGLDADLMAGLASRRASMAEISRLCVDGQFRRRRGEKESRFGNTATLSFDAKEKRTFSLLAVSLFLASAAVADLIKRPNCFAIMEPFLPAILRRIGVVVRRAGEDFEFNGTRAPYYINIDDARRAAPPEIRSALELIGNLFVDDLQPELVRQASRASGADPSEDALFLNRFLYEACGVRN